jgi:hypothetical protein
MSMAIDNNRKKNVNFIQKSKNHQRRISATLFSVKFGETCNFEVKCLLSVLFFWACLSKNNKNQ